MKLAWKPLATLALLGFASSPSQAATFVFSAILSGANEVPAVVSPGVGIGSATLDDVANTLAVSINFGGLLGNTTAAHIHCCEPNGTNAGVATTTPTFAGFPLGVAAGQYDITLDLTQASSFRAAFITANGGTVDTARAALITGLKDGRSYVNVHTSQFPTGEIRGQLLAVPEPATWATMIAGFGLVGGAMRRTRRRIAPA